MLKVIIQALTDSADEMRKSVHKMNQQIQETERILSSLRRISEFDDVRRILHKRLEDMREEKQQLMKLLEVLEQTQMMYHQCEYNITNFGDFVRQENYFRAMKVVQLDKIDAGIREYHIR